MLYRALGDVDRGVYIDIGAQDPDIDSVSKAFYERGWHGTHIEPVPEYAERLRVARPGDTIVEAAASNEIGTTTLTVFRLPDLARWIRRVRNGVSTWALGISPNPSPSPL